MTDSLFGIDPQGYKLWQGKTIYICTTPGMQLWYAFQCAKYHWFERPSTREEQKRVIKSFPSEVNNCRCRNCRYFRLVKKYE